MLQQQGLSSLHFSQQRLGGGRSSPWNNGLFFLWPCDKTQHRYRATLICTRYLSGTNRSSPCKAVKSGSGSMDLCGYYRSHPPSRPNPPPIPPSPPPKNNPHHHPLPYPSSRKSPPKLSWISVPAQATPKLAQKALQHLGACSRTCTGSALDCTFGLHPQSPTSPFKAASSA